MKKTYMAIGLGFELCNVLCRSTIEYEKKMFDKLIKKFFDEECATSRIARWASWIIGHSIRVIIWPVYAFIRFSNLILDE